MNKPNIVYVITDQHRLSAMGFWSKPEYRAALRSAADPVLTPYLDKFADESIVFTNAVSNCPLCSPYRGMLLSGLFPEKNGVKMNCKAGNNSSLREDIKCLTDVLSEAGYDTGYIGKYHLDNPKTHFDIGGNYVGEGGGYYINGSVDGETTCWDMITPPGPKRHSVNFWYSYGTFDVHKNPHYWDNDCKRHEPKVWSPKHDAETAIDYILNNKGYRDSNKPFCLYVSMNPPHTPYSSLKDTDEEIFAKYYGTNVIKDNHSLFVRPNVPEEERDKEFIRYYLSHVTGIDRQFGAILEAIDQSGQKDNTIVVYSSDHGDLMGSHGLYAKNEPYDECLLIPFIIRYGSRLSHRIEDMMLNGTDIMPTLLGLSGLADIIPEDVDGVDYSRYLLNTGSCEKPKSALYIKESLDTQRKGVYTDNYILVIEGSAEGKFEKYVLFDRISDPYQMKNLDFVDIPSEDLEFLRSELGFWLKKANDMWYQKRLFSDFILY